MINRLNPIFKQKQIEVADLYRQNNNAIEQLLKSNAKRCSPKNFKLAICDRHSLGLIAEIKRKSPSKGALAAISDPLSLVQNYILGGANAISVLTDQTFFDGNLSDLISIADYLKEQPQAILRKDFVIDEIQIAEAIVAGADAVLIIVALVQDNTERLLSAARAMQIDALVEVHNATELDIAVACGAEIIGINNRNLHTFEVDTQNAFSLIKYVPDHIIKVAESGITDPILAHAYYRAGFDAVLVGEALVKSIKPQALIKACRNVP